MKLLAEHFCRSADYAIDFLNQKQDKPFFLACGLFRPHLPWYAPKKYFDLYKLDKIVLPKTKENDLEDVPAIGKALAKAGRYDLERIRKAGKLKNAIQAYLASISYADAQLGRVLDALAKSPHAKNTIVVLWSDHGWHLGEKNHWHKSTLWEEATRVPFIIKAPGQKPGVSMRAVNLLSLYPTLNELCGLKPIASHDGDSLLPLIQNPKAEWKRPAVIEFRYGNVAVRSDRYRYIRYANGEEELYDHKNDPNEWHNLAKSSGHQVIKAKLAVWATKKWARPAAPKNRFKFNPKAYSFTNKKTGKTVSGK